MLEKTIAKRKVRTFAVEIELFRHGSRTTAELLLAMAEYEVEIYGHDNARSAREFIMLKDQYHPLANDVSFRTESQGLLDDLVKENKLHRVTRGIYRMKEVI